MLSAIRPRGGNPYAAAQIQFGQQTRTRQREQVQVEEHVAAEANAAVLNQRQVAYAVKVAKAPIPFFDHTKDMYSQAKGQQFLTTEFRSKVDPAGKFITGKALLDAFMTEQGLDTASVPPQDRFAPAKDYSGKSPLIVVFERIAKPNENAILQKLAKDHDVAFITVQQAFHDARRLGLLFRVDDQRNERTYFGVPYHVRRDLGLEPPVVDTPAPTTIGTEGLKTKQLKPDDALLVEAIHGVFTELGKIPPKDECLEYGAQLAHAAVEDGLIKPDDVPPPLKELVRKLAPNESLQDALLTLRDSSDGLYIPLHTAADLACKRGLDAKRITDMEMGSVA